MKKTTLALIAFTLFTLGAAGLQAADWPQWGGNDPGRNMYSPAKWLPWTFDPGTFKPGSEEVDLSTTNNVKWVAKLGSNAFGGPVVANGRVFIGTNNAGPRDPKYKEDRSCLYAFSEATGEFLWQLAVPKLTSGKVNDWEYLGIVSEPCVDNDKVYLVTNRCEVVCLDAGGMSSAVASPFKNEAEYLGGPGKPPIKPGPTDAKILWRYDLMAELGVFPHNQARCSIITLGNQLFTGTSNGMDWTHVNVPSPLSPSFIALDKNTGTLLGEDDAKIGPHIKHSQWGSPSLGDVGGRKQVYYGAGDGLLYAFDSAPVREGHANFLKTIWKFDCVPEEYKFDKKGKPIRYPAAEGPSEILATPVFYKNRVYVAIGQDPEHGEGVGRLVCVDATKTGDITKTGLIWDFKEIHRSMATVSIDPTNGLLFIADFSGFVYCLDADTGKKHWEYDMKSHMWGSTLVADGKVYCGDEDGDVRVFASDKSLLLLSDTNMGAPVYSTPIVANGVLYISTPNHLYAIVEGATLAVAPELNLFGDEIVTKVRLEDTQRPGGVLPEQSKQGARTASNRWPAGYEHALIFQDRRRLRGELVAVTKQEVEWRLPGAEGTLRFGKNEIIRVDLHADGDSAVPASGGWLAGQLEAVAGNKLIFSGKAKPLEVGLLVELQDALKPDVSPDTMLVLAGQGALGVADLEIVDGRIRGRSTLKTPIDIPISAGQMVVFSQTKPDAGPEGDTLVLQNGEELTGRLLSAGADEALRWRTHRGSQTTIDSSRVAGIRLFSAQPAPKPDGAVIEFRNGDRLRGSLDGFDGRFIHFKQSLLGPESVSVKDFWQLYQDSGTTSIDGSVRSSEWLAPESPSGAATWSYLDGSFIHRSGAPSFQIFPESPTWRVPMGAFMGAFPARFELSFNVSQANAKLPHFAVAISGPEGTKAQPEEGIRITESGMELDVQRYGGDRSKPPVPHAILLTKKLADLTSRVNCRLFVDSVRGTIDIFLNGTAFPQFRNHGSDRVPAKVRRVEIGEYSPTNVWSIFSDFRIAPWSGALPGAAGDQPWVMLDNGDSAPATLTGVRDGKLFMDSEAGPLELSMKQVLRIDCGGIPKPAQPTARVHLRDGSILQMDGCHFDGEELTGHSASFGEFKIPRESIAELVLHPAPPRFPCTFDANSSGHGQTAAAPGAAGVETKP